MDNKLIKCLAAGLAGGALGLVACGDDESKTVVTTVGTTAITVIDGTTQTTTTDVRTDDAGGPADPLPTYESCIALWNGANNITNQNLLASQTEPGDGSVINVFVNKATQPQTCTVTLVKGKEAIEWAEAHGQDFPYAVPNTLKASEIPRVRRRDNADVDKTGKLVPQQQ
jgi:hypothetical protein